MGTKGFLMSTKEQLLGAHTSIAGGLLKSVERTLSIGANAAQIFVKNNKQWFAADLQETEIKAFKNAVKDKKLWFCGHAGYLINPGITNAENHEKSLQSLEQEILRAEALGLPFTVLHPGNHGGKGEEVGLQAILESLNEIIDITKGCRIKIALETTAGQGSSLGHKFEHIAWLLEHLKVPERFGVCVDTAHLFAAGYDIREKTGFDATFKEFDKMIGYKQLLLIHSNDSKAPLGSRVDRHEHLGKGKIGLKAFEFIMKSDKLAEVPKILETPKTEDLQEDRENLAILKSFIP
jgi:deoxyribonuclease-4